MKHKLMQRHSTARPPSFADVPWHQLCLLGQLRQVCGSNCPASTGLAVCQGIVPPFPPHTISREVNQPSDNLICWATSHSDHKGIRKTKTEQSCPVHSQFPTPLALTPITLKPTELQYLTSELQQLCKTHCKNRHYQNEDSLLMLTALHLSA